MKTNHALHNTSRDSALLHDAQKKKPPLFIAIKAHKGKLHSFRDLLASLHQRFTASLTTNRPEKPARRLLNR